MIIKRPRYLEKRFLFTLQLLDAVAFVKLIQERGILSYLLTFIVFSHTLCQYKANSYIRDGQGITKKNNRLVVLFAECGGRGNIT